MTEKIRCSVPVLTLNSATYLADLLPMLIATFDDVFIIDGNSTDGTQELARSLGVRVERQSESTEPNLRITHFARARLHSWSLAKHDWIYWIDADEMPTPEQLEKVREIVVANDTRIVHRFIRLAQLPDGRIVRHALFYPEYTPRLWNRTSSATLVDRAVHEKFIIPDGVRLVDHPETYIARWGTPQEMWKRQRRYILMDAESVATTWSGLFRWVYLYNLRSFFGQLYRAIRSSFIGLIRHETALPWTYSYYFLLYRVLVVVESTKAWTKKRV
ncbi:MAG: glycosyltransferase [Patescibacteria group bacterium]